MRITITKSTCIRILLLVIATIYILFLYFDIFDKTIMTPTTFLKYISIVFCFIVSLLTGKDGLSRKDTSLLQAGLFVTLLADLFLLILNYYVVGIILFSIVQIIYFVRYKSYNSYRVNLDLTKFIFIFLFIIFTWFTIDIKWINIDFLYAIAVFYSICFLFSITEAIKSFRNNKYPYCNRYVILLGMALFVLCDISVAISNLAGRFNLSVYFSVLIWLFYLPSQVLLAISGYKEVVLNQI